MGSSNTGGGGGGGGGGGEKGGVVKAESPADAEDTNAAAGDSSAAPDSTPGQPAYAEGEKVLAFHGPRIYEAKGWNKNWDEWVENDRLLKFNEENVEKQKVLEKNHGAEKNLKSGRSAQNKPKGSNGLSILLNYMIGFSETFLWPRGVFVC
ncbi:hypothetical protein Taro_030441 [Colocasia esculenta]|uniref:Uncharacterized protein n=1 Tax=Colocasia esculenta TaxID=4460 RepID=A0A843VU24_COLES|nr:hypothetical protein [Colocasia esculenta]